MDTHTEKFKIRLGLFIAGGLALFVLAVFLIGRQKNLFNPVFELNTTFKNVSGLQVGNNIRFSGINVGTVDNITIVNDSTIKVEMLIRQNVKQFIKSDSKVQIGAEGFIGDKLLVLTQGGFNSPLAKKGQHLESTEPIETAEIIAQLAVTSGNVNIISRELAETMTKINSGKGTLGTLINNESIAKNVIRATEDASLAMFNIRGSSKEIQATSVNANRISQQLAQIIANINQGKGTLGKLIQDTVIARDFSQTISNIKKSAAGLDENMQAVKQNFLLKGFFNKKARAAEKELKENAKEIKQNLRQLNKEKREVKKEIKDSLKKELKDNEVKGNGAVPH